MSAAIAIFVRLRAVAAVGCLILADLIILMLFIRCEREVTGAGTLSAHLCAAMLGAKAFGTSAPAPVRA